MEIKINEKTGEYQITGKIESPLKLTKTGNSVLLDSTRGTLTTQTKYKGHAVKLNVNITVPNPAAAKPEAQAAPEL